MAAQFRLCRLNTETKEIEPIEDGEGRGRIFDRYAEAFKTLIQIRDDMIKQTRNNMPNLGMSVYATDDGGDTYRRCSSAEVNPF